MAATTKTKSLDALLDAAYAEESISREDILGSKGFVSTGNLVLDYKLGGGLPRGRTAEFYGPSQTAKTTAALEVAVQVQRAGGVVVYIDFEQALDTAYMRSVGLDVDDRSTFKPYPAATLEKGMNFARAAVNTGEVDLVIIDSVPAMVPESAATAEAEQSRTMAMERARLLGGAVGALNPALARTGAIAIYINHERDVINTTGMPQRGPAQKTTAGGTGLKFYSSVRIQFKTIKKLPSDVFDPASGETVKRNHSQISRLTITKNKVASPDQYADVCVEFGKGFNNTYSAMAVLIANKVCSKAGAFYRFPEELYHAQMPPNKNGKGGSMQGMAAVLELAEFDAEWAELVASRAREALGTAEVQEVVPSMEVEDGEDPEDSEELSDTDAGVETAAFVPRRGGGELESTLAAPSAPKAGPDPSDDVLRLIP